MRDNKPKSPAELNQMLQDMEKMSKEAASPAKPESQSGGALKSLLGFFVKIHDEDEDKPALPAPAKPQASEPVKPMPSSANKAVGAGGPMPTPRRVGELVSDEPAPKFDRPKVSSVEDRASIPFTEIYREAGINASKSNIDELADLLQNPTIANQPMTVKVMAVSLALTAKGGKIDEYIADAVRKDRALDAYQLMLNEHASEVETRTKSEIERIQKEVEEFLKRKQVEMEQLREQANGVSRQAIEFAVRRQEEEQRLANIISPFLEGNANPVTIGNTPEKPVQK
jgi:hypothetical protein